MIVRLRFQLASFFFILLIGVGSVCAQSGPVYLFTENLPDAEVFFVQEVKAQKSYMKNRKEEIYAVWDDGQFSFKDSVSEHPIKIVTQTYEGSEEQGIYFHPSEGVKKAIRFFNVTPGAKLRLRYGIDDKGIAIEKPATIYFSIFIGSKRIARMQIANKPGWKQKTIDLGAIAYLRRSVAVTFEVTCDNADMRHFAFSGEIYK